MNDAQRELITAYHDGELDALAGRSVRKLVDSDPDARAYLDALQRLDAGLHEAFDPILRQPVPASLQAVVRRGRRRRLTRFFVPLGLAASLLLVALLLVRQGLLDRQMQDQMLHMRQQIAQLRQQTLENVPSGTPASWVSPAGKGRVEVLPVKTYRTADNQFCREYEERVKDARGVEVRRGIACRTGKALWSDLIDVPPAGGGGNADRPSPAVNL